MHCMRYVEVNKQAMANMQCLRCDFDADEGGQHCIVCNVYFFQCEYSYYTRKPFHLIQTTEVRTSLRSYLNIVSCLPRSRNSVPLLRSSDNDTSVLKKNKRSFFLTLIVV